MDGGTARKRKEEEGGDSKLHTDPTRKGWMHYAVVAAVLEGKMSRGDAVEVAAVMAAEVPVSDLAVVGFAFAPCRRLS